MSYNNYSRNNQGYDNTQNSGYDRNRNYNNGGGYRGGNGGRYNRGRNDASKKHSGAKFHANTKNGAPAIVAWNYSRRTGLVSVFIAPYKNTSEHKSQNGNVYENWMCKIEGKGIASEHFPVLVNMATKKATIEHGYGWVVNPSAPNGGYCGTFKK